MRSFTRPPVGLVSITALKRLFIYFLHQSEIWTVKLLRLSWKFFSRFHCVASFVSFQPWQSEEEGSWLREYPVTLMQFFRYLYHNVSDLAPMWHSPEFLCALAAAVFPFNIRPYSEMVSLSFIFSLKQLEIEIKFCTREELAVKIILT